MEDKNKVTLVKACAAGTWNGIVEPMDFKHIEFAAVEAACAGQTAMLRLLADVHVPDAIWHKSFRLACLRGHIDCARFIISVANCSSVFMGTVIECATFGRAYVVAFLLTCTYAKGINAAGIKAIVHSTDDGNVLQLTYELARNFGLEDLCAKIIVKIMMSDDTDALVWVHNSHPMDVDTMQRMCRSAAADGRLSAFMWYIERLADERLEDYYKIAAENSQVRIMEYLQPRVDAGARFVSAIHNDAYTAHRVTVVKYLWDEFPWLKPVDLDSAFIRACRDNNIGEAQMLRELGAELCYEAITATFTHPDTTTAAWLAKLWPYIGPEDFEAGAVHGPVYHMFMELYGNQWCKK